MRATLLALTALILSTLFTMGASAEEVVTLTLRNGRQVIGKLIEHVPGERIVVRGNDQRIWRFNGADTATVRVEPVASSAQAPLASLAQPEPAPDEVDVATTPEPQDAYAAPAPEVERAAGPGPGPGPGPKTGMALPATLMSIGAASMLIGGVIFALEKSDQQACEPSSYERCLHEGARPAGKGLMIGGAVLTAIGLVILPIRMVARDRERERGWGRRADITPWISPRAASGAAQAGLTTTLRF